MITEQKIKMPFKALKGKKQFQFTLDAKIIRYTKNPKVILLLHLIISASEILICLAGLIVSLKASSSIENQLMQTENSIDVSDVKDIPGFFDPKNKPAKIHIENPYELKTLLDSLSENAKRKSDKTRNSFKCNNGTFPKTTPGCKSATLALGSDAFKGNERIAEVNNWIIYPRNGYLNEINVKDGRILINESGLYHIYCQVYFGHVYHPNGIPPGRKILEQFIFRHNINLPNKGYEKLAHSAGTEGWDSNRKYTDYTSYTSLVVKLQAGDSLLTRFSNMDYISRDPSSTFFGLYKVQ